MFGLLLSAVIAFFHVKNWLVLAVKDEQLTIASVAQTTTEQWIASSKESMKTFAKKRHHLPETLRIMSYWMR